MALKDIRVPTLLLYRGDDRLKRPDLGRGISAEIAGARFMEIPNALPFSPVKTKTSGYQ